MRFATPAAWRLRSLTVGQNRGQDTLWRLVRERDLKVSVGSDFHRDSPYGAGLGVEVSTIPDGAGIWEQL